MPSKAQLWTGRVLSALPVLLLLMSATLKFIKSPDVIAGMAQFGYQENILFTLGCLELGCTLLYIFPRTAVLGAILLTGYLGGATATHARVGDIHWIIPVVLGVVIWLGLWLRDERLRALTPFRS